MGKSRDPHRRAVAWGRFRGFEIVHAITDRQSLDAACGFSFQHSHEDDYELFEFENYPVIVHYELCGVCEDELQRTPARAHVEQRHAWRPSDG